MSLGCARCGDCCDPVKIDFDVWARTVALARRYTADDISAEYRDRWADAVFVASRLRPLFARGRQLFLECANWDGEHDRCGDYEHRPPLCRRFPHYDGAAVGEVCELRCSYLLDVPPAERPAGARPLIPLMVVRPAAERPQDDDQPDAEQQ